MSITLSEAAAERVRRFLRADPRARAMRLGVKRTGCSGYAYVVELTDRVDEQDRVFDVDDIRVVVDPKSLPLVDGTHIDFARDGINEGFRYDNPNVRSLCGCGESFGV